MRRSHPLFVALPFALAVVTASCHEAPPDESVRPNGGTDPGAGRGQDDPGSVETGDAATSQGGSRDGGGPNPGEGGRGGPTSGSGGDDPAGGNAGEGGSTTDAAIPPTPQFTKRNLLKAAADCVLVQYRDFETKAKALARATQAYADDADAEHLAVAREAWLVAMASFERAEIFSFGPAARRRNDPNGRDLRDEIYAFPHANACGVDEQIVSQAYAESSFPSTLIGTRGLAAIEYLLFRGGTTNSCSASFGINQSGSWAALSETELRQRRAEYAAAAAADVVARISTLLEAWEPSEGNFYAQLTDPRNGTAYASDQDALNAVSDGLFYMENEVKDLKLGWPLGLVPDCFNSPDPCPDEVESRHARVSTDHLRQNLRGFRALFQGCGPSASGLGFDDWLHQVGSADLSDRMLEALDAAEQAVDTLDPPLEQALVADIADVRALHAAVKRITDLMKTEFVTVLNLELPEGSIGDND